LKKNNQINIKYKGSWQVFSSIYRSEKWTGPVFFLVTLTIILRYLFEIRSNGPLGRFLETTASVQLWVRVLFFAEAEFETVGLTMSIVRRMVYDISVYVSFSNVRYCTVLKINKNRFVYN
jgi:hypothetical protein